MNENLKPIYVPGFESGDKVNLLIREVAWVNEQARRQECFMSDLPREYQYIENGPVYKSIEFHPLVKSVMEKINQMYGYNMNVCFLNYYQDQTKALGWHADDAKEINQEEPICVISYGQAREIWWRPKDQRGDVPEEQRQLLEDGSLYVMPAGFQDVNFHRIPKGSSVMGPRISLTYRCWK